RYESPQRNTDWTRAVRPYCAVYCWKDSLGEDFALLGAVLALMLPFLAGALSAISSGKVRRATSVGLWSGMIGGLIGFFVFTGVAYLRPLLLGVPVLAALEREEYYPFLFAIHSLFLYGPIFCPVAATVGGWIGLQLEKT